jgi:hypothetical protein
LNTNVNVETLGQLKQMRSKLEKLEGEFPELAPLKQKVEFKINEKVTTFVNGVQFTKSNLKLTNSGKKLARKMVKNATFNGNSSKLLERIIAMNAARNKNTTKPYVVGENQSTRVKGVPAIASGYPVRKGENNQRPPARPNSAKVQLNSWINKIKNNRGENVPPEVKSTLKGMFPANKLGKLEDNKEKSRKYLLKLLEEHSQRPKGMSTTFMKKVVSRAEPAPSLSRSSSIASVNSTTSGYTNSPANKFVLVTHNSDQQFTKQYLDTIRPYISHIYAINCNFQDPLLTAIPLGFVDSKHKPHNKFEEIANKQLEKTIKSAIENAKRPKNLVFGIARQFHPEDKFDTLDEYRKDKRFRILDIPFEKSNGACWARNQIQQLYQGEEYTLQIDSHMRFDKNWDDEMIKMIKQLQKKGHKKPLLTGYVSSFNPDNDPAERIPDPWRMVFDRFIPEGAVFFLPETIPGWQDLKEPVPSRFYSAHYCFTLGEFSKEVQHDPEFYFHGEEISIAARAYTHGYDLFHPHKTLIWHEYTRKGRTKHDERMGLIAIYLGKYR